MRLYISTLRTLLITTSIASLAPLMPYYTKTKKDALNFQFAQRETNLAFSRFALQGRLESFSDTLPVDDVPYGIDIVWSHILVLKIISMFPNIYSKKRVKTYKM